MPGDHVNPHVWLGGGGFSTDAMERNLLPFLRRHGYSVVLTEYSLHPETAGDSLDSLLETTREAGIEAWVGTGIVPGAMFEAPDERDWSDRALLADDALMADFLEAQRAVARTYADHYPDGKIILWHEEPTRGNWTGDTYGEQSESIVEYGPAIFERQYDALTDVSAGFDVGLFPHDLPVAPPAYSTVSVWGPLMDAMRERGTVPDFTYVDSYRSQYEWAAGYDPANEYIGAVIANAKEQTGGRPVYYLGGPHTENNHYTASRQALLGNFQTAVDAGVDSFGWYIRGQYHRTSERNFDPYVPNYGDVDETQFTSFTGSRDRLVWANLLAVEQRSDFEATEAFDLWLYGHDLDHYEHAVSLRDDSGDWVFVGDVSGYVDGENAYAGGGCDRVCVLHALDRERFLGDDRLDVRLEGGGDGGTLHRVDAMPYSETGVYRTELRATALVETSDAAAYALGTWRGPADLVPGECLDVTVDVDTPSAPLRELVYPVQHDAYERMRALETDGSIEDHFDLWVYGHGLTGLTVEANGTDVAEYADPRAGTAFDGPEALVFRGMDRDSHLTGHTAGRYLDLALDGEDAVVNGVYAMPCGGARNFQPDPAVASTVAEDAAHGAGQLSGFCLGSQVWPDGVRPPAETWLHVRNARVHRGRRREGAVYLHGHEPGTGRRFRRSMERELDAAR